MVTTYAQAQETAEDWINAGVPRSQHREVKVREFDLGYVCWAVDGSETGGGPGTSPRLVIARDSGASTLWPPLPVNEVVRQFEELYGAPSEPNPAGPAKPVRGAVEATSFLLSPPQWLQEAGAAAIAAEAASLGGNAGPGGNVPAPPAPPVSAAPPARLPEPGGEGPSYFTGATGTPAPGTPVPPPPGSEAATVLAPGVPFPSGDGPSTPFPGAPVPPPPGSEAATVLAPGLPFPPDGPAGPVPPPPGATPPFPAPGADPAATLLAPPPGATPPYPVGGPPGAVPPPPGAPAPGVPGLEHAATMLATDGPPGLMGLPGAPGRPGGPAPAGRGGAGAPPPPPPGQLLANGGGPAPSGTGRGGPGTPPPPPPNELLPNTGGGPASSGTGRGGPGAPPPPAPGELRPDGGQPAPAAPPTAAPAAGSEAAAVAYQATQLAPAIELPVPPPGGAVPPPFPGAPQGAPFQAPPPFPGAPVPPPQGAPFPPPGQGFPPGGPAPAAPPSGTPTIGPGSTAVVNYRAPDGSERSLVMTSEPGTPHPEWKALQELRRLGVPPDQVLEVHTDLELCDLPAGYCARMVKASWPNARISHTAPYGRDTAARQAGMAVLNEHVEQLHQLVSAPPRPRTVRVPLPAPGSVPPSPVPPPQQLAGEFGQLFGHGMFRFEQRAVARQGVPEPVAQTLMWVGLPREFPPFFWAQAQEGRPIPTLAELAAERGLPPGPDFGGYLVLGNDYGRQLCVQYGTAAVVAVDVENPAEPPRFVNSGVPEFVHCLLVLARMWRLRHGLTPEQAGRWTTDFQAQLLAADPAALQTPESWWAVLVEQLWDGLL
ncbi:SUKH-4 family immunity protein [Kitasatospora sp. NPDC088134]|uniref:SUKH-4 family immunity protein n=1 Tax=Kitasatospora sp. NPDC088134 TaxID=3364071 RepID=UPI0037F6C7F7